jgi:uncharacterized membrane protein YbaN (DUF454 family)
LARPLWLAGGLVSVALGAVGVFLPILPTVPFLLLAAFCFARSNPAWEQRLLDHPRFGVPLRQWRERRAISRTAKLSALLALAFSAMMGFVALPLPWAALPAVVAVITGAWIWSRAE